MLTSDTHAIACTNLFSWRSHAVLYNYNCMKNTICFHPLNIQLDWLDASLCNVTEEHVHLVCLQQQHLTNNDFIQCGNTVWLVGPYQHKNRLYRGQVLVWRFSSARLRMANDTVISQLQIPWKWWNSVACKKLWALVMLQTVCASQFTHVQNKTTLCPKKRTTPKLWQLQLSFLQ